MTQDAEGGRLTLPVSERDHSQGPDDAPVTLVEYGDYECPYCGRAYPIVKDVQQRMGDRLTFEVDKGAAEAMEEVEEPESQPAHV